MLAEGVRWVSCKYRRLESMLVLTVQESNVAQMMKSGRYEADFWKSKFGCVSARFTRGYSIISGEIR